MILSAQQMATATGGTLKRNGTPGTISTDTRTITPEKDGTGIWFLALIGARFDAHNFLEKARELGCSGIVAQHAPQGWDRGFIQVPDTLIALQDLARFARNQFTGPVIGITGSAGKTTTRQMVAIALSPLGKVHATKGNYNNHIGLPLTILSAPQEADYWVLELGMNALGEISLLQEISRPTHRLITNVAAAHLEGLGSIEQVAQAKGELFDGATSGDCIFINNDDKYIRAHPLPPNIKTVSYGQQKHNCLISLEEASLTGLSTQIKLRFAELHTQKSQTLDFTLPSPGLHLAHNSCAAAAVAYQLGVPPEQITAQLSSYQPVGARLKLEEGPNGYHILNDVYNANPLSMLASVQTLSAVNMSGRKVALLGDMLEMGTHEIEEHMSLLKNLPPLSLLGLVGPRFTQAAERLLEQAPSAIRSKCITAPTARELVERMNKQGVFPLTKQDIVLFKGSRGIKMEQAISAIKDLHTT